MKSAYFLGFCQTILVTLALFGAGPAFAKNERAVCDELMLSESFTEAEIQRATALIDGTFALGLGPFGMNTARAQRIDAILVLVLRDRAEYTLEESAREYALSVLSLSGFCGQYGLIEDGHRLRAARSMIALLPWLSRAQAAEFTVHIENLLPVAATSECR